jgi:hypothetical protein
MVADRLVVVVGKELKTAMIAREHPGTPCTELCLYPRKPSEEPWFKCLPFAVVDGRQK